MSVKSESKVKKSSVKARREYSKVVESAELMDISLFASDFLIEDGYFEILGEARKNRQQLDFFCQCKLSVVEYDTDSGILLGQFDWKACAKKDETKLLEVNGRYVICYECKSKVNAEAAKRFMSRVGRFATFPYFRSLVGLYNTSSGAELPVLPVLKDRVA